MAASVPAVIQSGRACNCDYPRIADCPPAIADRFRPTPTVPRSNAFTVVRAMSLLPLLLRLTAPVKSLPAFVKVIALAPEITFVVESASIAPVCVTAPFATNVNAPVASEAATSIALASVMLTAAPEKSRLEVRGRRVSQGHIESSRYDRSQS